MLIFFTEVVTGYGILADQASCFEQGFHLVQTIL
jgi:hypothetical protein